MVLKKRNGTNLSRTDSVVVYPSDGRQTRDGSSWRIQVRGTVYDPGSVSRRKHLLLRLLQRVAGVYPTGNEQAMFERRIRAFIAPTERGKRISVRVANRVHHLRRKTQRNGGFSATIRVSNEDIALLRRSGDVHDGWLNLQIVSPHVEHGRCDGTVRLLEETGLSVISDIDDTLKLSEVHCRRSLIANTFLREYQPITGMADRYRQWAAEGARFHYVSSSPWQLFEPLTEELFSAAGYPLGSFHLRSFRLREHMLRRMLLIRRHGKASSIRAIVRGFPNRCFVLVGDSGEKDPEIYAELARRFPSQVLGIYIRNLPHHPLDEARQRRIFRNLHPSLPNVFTMASELPESLQHLLELGKRGAVPTPATVGG